MLLETTHRKIKMNYNDKNDKRWARKFSKQEGYSISTAFFVQNVSKMVSLGMTLDLIRKQPVLFGQTRKKKILFF